MESVSQNVSEIWHPILFNYSTELKIGHSQATLFTWPPVGSRRGVATSICYLSNSTLYDAWPAKLQSGKKTAYMKIALDMRMTKFLGDLSNIKGIFLKV